MKNWRTFIMDSIRSAALSLWAKKTRSVLSILGIVIGILTVSSLLTIAFNVRDQVEKSISGLGANLVLVLPGNVGGGGGFSAQLGASTLTERDVAAIRSRVPEARQLSMSMLLAGTVTAGDKSVRSSVIFGASPGFEKAFSFKIARGRFPDQEDENQRARVAVLGDTAARELFGDDSVVGKDVVIRGERFTVIGTLEQVSSAGNLGGPDFNSIILLPLETAWQMTNTRQIFRIAMQAPTPEDVVPLKNRVRDVLLAQHGGEEDFSVLTQDDLISLAGDILDLLTSMIGAIAGISLVVGGIGIMNIMLVTVSERTKEIGIRKAVGATRGAILGQFLVESVILTFAGGVTAVLLFVGLVKAIASHIPIPLNVNPWVLGAALAFSAVVGIVFGVIPAWQASRKDPIVALRSE